MTRYEYTYIRIGLASILWYCVWAEAYRNSGTVGFVVAWFDAQIASIKENHVN